MAAPDRLVSDWTDVNAAFLRTAWYVNHCASAAALNTALAGASNGGIAIQSQGLAVITPVFGVGAMFPSVLDVAVLNFVTAAGTLVQLQIPAPLNSDFTQSRLVNAADPNVLAVIVAATGFLSDNLGNLVTAFSGGSYSSRRKEQQS